MKLSFLKRLRHGRPRRRRGESREAILARRRRRIAVVPSLLTLLNGVCGFASIIVASRIHPSALMEQDPGHADAMEFLFIAGLLIFAGMIFDVFDGLTARLAQSASRFGAELDSLCDVITFGAAPAFLMLKMGPLPDQHPTLYKVLFVAATAYVMCTILRLARFNVETAPDVDSHRFFKGLPSPAAAGCLAAVAVMRHDFQIYQRIINLDLITDAIRTVVPFVGLGLGLLMVSNLAYPHLVNQSLRGKHSFSHLVSILTVVIMFVLVPQLLLMIAFWGFALTGPVRRVMRRFAQARQGEQPAVTPASNERPSRAGGS